MSNREAILEAARRVEVFSASALSVVGAIQDPEYPIDDICSSIEKDPVLAAGVISVSNSSMFSPAEPILSVRDAVSRLGARSLMSAVLASMGPSLPETIEGYQLQGGALWDHAVAMSLATRELAEALDFADPESAATAALVSDVGKIVLDPFIVSSETSVNDYSYENGVSYDEAERAVFGIDHAEVGADLLERWGLPEPIVQATRWHHDPDQCPEEHRGIAELVHLAESICTIAGIGLGADGMQYRTSKSAASHLKFDNAVAEQVLSRVIASVADFEQSTSEE